MNRRLNLIAAATLSVALLPVGAGIAGAAGLPAQSPPAPTVGVQDIANPPLMDSGRSFGQLSQSWTRTSFHIDFKANVATALMQVSTKAPTKNSDGRYSMAAVPPVVVKAAATGGGLSDSNSMRSFAKTVTGLEQGRTYYYLLTLPTAPGFKPVQRLGEVATIRHGQHKTSAGHGWVDVSFVADRSLAYVALGTSGARSGVAGLKGGNAIALKGTQISGGKNPVFRFGYRFNSLRPDTTYYVLTSLQKAHGPYDQELITTRTKKRQVTVTVTKIKVIDDADGLGRGKGDLLFQVRGTSAPTKAGDWGSWYGETQIGSGTTVNLLGSPKAPKHTFTTRANSTRVQLEGRESDWVTKSDRKFCESVYNQPGQAHVARWLNSGDSGSTCYQFSFAEAQVNLPTTFHTGTSVSYADISVPRSPSLRFSARVKVEVKSVN